jgi:caa(3)-type oxidase subunit IV
MATDSHAGETKETKNKRGLIVLIVLAVLTVAEFFAAIWFEGALQLTLLGGSAILKALGIAHYFMHWRQVLDHIADIAAGDAEVVED